MKYQHKLLLISILIILFSIKVNATVFTVNSNADLGTGTGTSGDLRYCINQAIATPLAAPHTINFAITPAGVATITLTNDLPTITISNITIDAHTQTGVYTKPGVIITRTGGNNGFNIGQNPPVITNVIIRGFIIQGFQNGVNISNANSIKVQGCWINVNAAGTASTAGGMNGVNLNGSASDTIGGPQVSQRNVIVACSSYGISTTSTCSRLVIKNNFIGVLPNGIGTAATGTTQHGIFLNGVPYCTIGGTQSLERNVISWTGSNGDGILVDAGSLHAQIIGNLIGTDSTGTIAYGLGKEGVFVQNNSTAPTINYNVIAKATAYGIHINSVDSVTIKGNKIGVNINGTGTGFGNINGGIFIQNQVGGANSQGHTIGGSTAQDRNVIANNGAGQSCSGVCQGIEMEQASNSTITGNYIGVDATGLVAAGNGGSGILLQNGTTNITVGGTAAGEGNVISANGFTCTGGGGRHGIQLYNNTVTGIVIQGNIVGLGSDGTTMLGNDIDGVNILQPNGNTVGGNSAAARNIVSGNTYGVHIQGSGAGSTYNNLVLNNYIGTDITGTLKKPNSSYGVVVDNGAGLATSPNYIGKPGQGNLISGNGYAGIAMMGNGSGGGTPSQYTNIYSNTIGLSSTGSALANDTGILIKEGSNSNFIGSQSIGTSAGNTIAYNTTNGVFINGTSTDLNWISENSFYCNGNSYAAAAPQNKGINLNGTGNNNYTTPTVNTIGAGSTITTLTGTAPANSIVEIFQVEPCVTCPAAGGISIEGKTYVATVTANAAGNWTWTPGGNLAGSYTATATQPTGTYRNTSEFATCAYITLPITLMSFTGSFENGKTELLWSTATEINNKEFLIEKSSDGINFTTIGTVNGAGNSSVILNYSFEDPNATDGIEYYRLQQVDFNGKSSYSNVISINISGNDLVKIYPSPTNGKVSIEFSLKESSAFIIEVISPIGNILYNKEGNASKAFYEEELDLSLLSPGLYLVNVQTSQEVSVAKIIKQ